MLDLEARVSLHEHVDVGSATRGDTDECRVCPQLLSLIIDSRDTAEGDNRTGSVSERAALFAQPHERAV